MPVLKRLKFSNQISLQLIVKKTHAETMALKRLADIGIDEIANGGYHLSGLEFLALGIPCFANLDNLTTDVVKKVTGCTGELPWLAATPATFEREIKKILHDRSWQELGKQSRDWMERYWSPAALLAHYEAMYHDILENRS